MRTSFLRTLCLLLLGAVLAACEGETKLRETPTPPKQHQKEIDFLELDAAVDASGKIVVTWNALSQAQEYKVYKNGTFFGTSDTTFFSDTSYQIEDSDANSSGGGQVIELQEEVVFQVQAFDQDGQALTDLSEAFTLGSKSGSIQFSPAVEIFALETELAEPLLELSWQSSAARHKYLLKVDQEYFIVKQPRILFEKFSHNTAYQVEIYHINPQGMSSGKGLSKQLISPSLPPENFRLHSITDSSIAFSWEPSDNSTGYAIHRDNQIIAKLDNKQNYFVDTNLVRNSKYSYSLASQNSAGALSFAQPLEAITAYETTHQELDSTPQFAIDIASRGSEVFIQADSAADSDSYFVLYRSGVAIDTSSHPYFIDRGATRVHSYQVKKLYLSFEQLHSYSQAIAIDTNSSPREEAAFEVQQFISNSTGFEIAWSSKSQFPYEAFVLVESKDAEAEFFFVEDYSLSVSSLKPETNYKLSLAHLDPKTLQIGSFFTQEFTTKPLGAELASLAQPETENSEQDLGLQEEIPEKTDEPAEGETENPPEASPPQINLPKNLTRPGFSQADLYFTWDAPPSDTTRLRLLKNGQTFLNPKPSERQFIERQVDSPADYSLELIEIDKPQSPRNFPLSPVIFPLEQSSNPLEVETKQEDTSITLFIPELPTGSQFFASIREKSAEDSEVFALQDVSSEFIQFASLKRATDYLIRMGAVAADSKLVQNPQEISLRTEDCLCLKASLSKNGIITLSWNKPENLLDFTLTRLSPQPLQVQLSPQADFYEEEMLFEDAEYSYRLTARQLMDNQEIRLLASKVVSLKKASGNQEDTKPAKNFSHKFILNAENTASSFFKTQSPQEAPALVNVTSLEYTKKNNQTLAKLTTYGIADYQVLTDQDVVANLLARDPNQFQKALPEISLGATIVFGENIGFMASLLDSECREFGGSGYFPSACPQAQKLSYEIPAEAKPAEHACSANEESPVVGIAINGVALMASQFVAADGKISLSGDLALEQDICQGIVQNGKYAHLHYSSCLALLAKDSGEGHSPVYGYALDGYPIHGPWQDADSLAQSSWKLEAKGELDNQQTYYFARDLSASKPEHLDKHNGHSHEEDGYHYHFTLEKDGKTPQYPFIIGPEFYGELEESAEVNCR